MTRLVLASASPARAGLLRQSGVAFEVRPAHVDEAVVRDAMRAEHADGRAIAGALAELKALRVSASDSEALVLGADQVLVCEDALLSKPETIPAARSQLQWLCGRPHQLLTAAVLARDGTPLWRHVDASTLRMRPFSDAFLEAYLAQEGDAVLGSVGCYRLEAMGVQLFEHVDGDYFSILGLPLVPLLAALRQQGVMET
jgi:septum formation protein